MARAVWNDTVIAESAACEIVDGNHYFPPDSIKQELFVESPTRSTCPWKGEAAYYTIKAGGSENIDAAWTYPQCKPEAKSIEGYVAFWKGVQIEA